MHTHTHTRCWDASIHSQFLCINETSSNEVMPFPQLISSIMHAYIMEVNILGVTWSVPGWCPPISSRVVLYTDHGGLSYLITSTYYTHTHILTPSHTHTHSLTHTYTLTWSCAHTHTHTHTHSHKHLTLSPGSSHFSKNWRNLGTRLWSLTLSLSLSLSLMNTHTHTCAPRGYVCVFDYSNKCRTCFCFTCNNEEDGEPGDKVNYAGLWS